MLARLPTKQTRCRFKELEKIQEINHTIINKKWETFLTQKRNFHVHVSPPCFTGYSIVGG